MAEGYILPYLDIPLQHASQTVLKAMRRPANHENMLRRIENWRNICKDIAIRTTLITGFPEESVHDFEMLVDFIKQVRFNRLGVFEFSNIEGATASQMGGQIDPEIKEIRRELLLSHQADISSELLQGRFGRHEQVIVDEVQDKWIITRSKYDSPEIDGQVLIEASGHQIVAGDILSVTITDADEHDLFAKMN
jgi:ribosomal protein S12 methylthiotransferase